MADLNYITLTKGSTTATIYIAETNDNWENKLFLITPPTAPDSQPDGPKTPKVIDLLRVTRTCRVRGYIAAATLNAAYLEINKLRYLANGAGQSGGSCTAILEADNPDADYGTITGFIEKLTITRRPGDLDATKTYADDTIWFDVDIAFTWGIAIGEQE